MRFGGANRGGDIFSHGMHGKHGKKFCAFRVFCEKYLCIRVICEKLILLVITS